MTSAHLRACFLVPCIFLLAGCPKTQAPEPLVAPVPDVAHVVLEQHAEALLADYRRTIVLMQGEKDLPPDQRQAVASVGQMLFHKLQQEQQDLIAAADAPTAMPGLVTLFDRIENDASWFDADRLAFKEFVAEMAQRFRQAQTLDGLRLGKRASEDLAVLGEIEQAYDRELKDVFGQFSQRGIVPKREKWADYVVKLQALYQRDQILKEYGANPAVPPPVMRSGKATGEAREIFGSTLPPRTVLLTFDDGPHGTHTDEILEILKRYGVQAVFFELGQNLGRIDSTGKARLGPKAVVTQRVLAAGHQLADHSFSHGQMSKMPDRAVLKEASDTEALLDAAGRTGPLLFRFPYGARNADKLDTIESLHLRSMMWSVDSLDWADPVPKSIAQRVLAEVGKSQRGVVLFHDIQARTVQALPLVLDQLVADGYQFASWRNGGFVVAPAPARPEPQAALAASGSALYRDSHALIIGIDRYTRWPALHHAVADARAIQETLVERFGFRPENVTGLFDGDATRANILHELNQRLTDPTRVKRDDRVMVFFAGHGSTRMLASGREVGYIVPVDASTDNFAADAISMPQLQEVAEALAAKHVLFMIDACYSGLGLTRGGAPPSRSFLQDNGRRIGRQMLTAGGADQQVADDGPGGHSVFTWTVLQALSGKGDLNGDGLMTGTELAAYVAPAVASIAQQTPAFGSLPGSEGGEFVFQLPVKTEALSGDSIQLDADAGRLNQRIDQAQASAEHAVPAAGRTKAATVEVVVKNLDGGHSTLSLPAAAALTPQIAAQQANDRGLSLYRERRYDEAEAAFTDALGLQPRFALAANNLGFVYYKRGKPVEAARWFQRAVEMDGTRALAYLNLGDAQLQAGDELSAMAAYTTFVGLAPRHVRAAALQAWIAAPASAPRPVLPVAG